MGKQRHTGADLDPSFASDNVAGISPEILDAVERANHGSALPYGADAESTQLQQWAQQEFGPQAEIYPVFNGTGANVVALQAVLPRWGAAICSAQAHVNNDEGAAPERLGAMKLLPRPSSEGKLAPEDITEELGVQGFVHAAQPLAVTVTQSTELGTVYTPDEIRSIADVAHAAGLAVHVDGSRLSNAAAALDCSLADTTAACGVDILSLGATKNGALAAEAVVVVNPERVAGADYIRKFSMQLASKQRFLSAQLLALFGTDLWHRHATHANEMAALLAERLRQVPGVKVNPPSVNAVFPEVPTEVAERIQSRYLAHTWDTSASGQPVLRLMCSFATTGEEIDRLIAVAAGT
ncbi:threonine aldolase family protein [Nesterenkonia alba]|uniref:threonine aldolase family protein n=1 Tax=Nesterenkonia alba TaxID=515814 RepID=UPI000525FBB1|nr:beta-eliminating lyase-related protein [Nesterenkonia alba]